MKTINGKLLLFGVLLSLVGCSGKPMHIESVDQLTKNNEVDFAKGKEITASSSGFQLLLFIPININSRHENAYQSLRTQAGKDYITDVKIEESWSYAFVGTIYTTRLKAMAYPLK